MKVYIYRNLGPKFKNTTMYSLKDTKTGRVADRRPAVLVEDVTFKVSKAGQARVRREQKKYVHAGVQGTVMPLETIHSFEVTMQGQWIPVYYNPYKVDTFIRKDTLEPIHTAKRAYIGEHGIYAQI